jgi:hypothetical protein
MAGRYFDKGMAKRRVYKCREIFTYNRPMLLMMHALGSN